MTRRLPFLAGCLVLTAVPLLADEAEDKAVEADKELGGMVTRDEKAEGKPVVAVDLRGSLVLTDADLKELAPLKELRTLYLGGTEVTDACLKELAALKGLQELYLFGCREVTAAGVAELRKALPDCKITR